MAQKKRGLGRGLESLLSNDFDDTPETGSELVELELDALKTRFISQNILPRG